jgi:methyl-accepting chemotaxis protein
MAGFRDTSLAAVERFERALDASLKPPVLAAWRQMALALYAGKPVDTQALARACAVAHLDVSGLLTLSQATLNAAWRAEPRGWRPFGGAMAEPPAGVGDRLHAVTAGLVAALFAPVSEAPALTQGAPQNLSAEQLNDLERQSTWLMKATDRTAALSGRVAECCGEVLQSIAVAIMGINTTAEAGEQVTQSIETVSRELSRTADASRDASESANKAAEVIQDLEQAASRIGSVTDIIRRIASQTNLLALNATIEAARAGEAGRGFAVVAKEVKDLAQQTAKATTSIGETIDEIRAAVRSASDRVLQIQRTTADVRQMAAAGAEAVEQQRLAVHEINRSAQEASGAVNQMHAGLEAVAEQSFELTTSTEELLAGAEVLHAKATSLAKAS